MSRLNCIIKTLLSAALCVCLLACFACSVPDDNNGSENGGSDMIQTTNSPENTTPTAAAGQEPTSAPPAETPEPVIPEGAVKWINACADPDAIIMTHAQISDMNKEMRNICDALTDIAAYPQSLTKDEIVSLIESSSGPSLPKYDENGTEITQTDMSAIRENRNLDALLGTNKLIKGVTVQRTDIRALPTEREFYNSASVQDHDRMQESELSAASAVLILHKSLDGKFYFIQSYYYVGWVLTENVAIADTNSDWDIYAGLLNMDGGAFESGDFAVITDSQITANGAYLDMGTALPLDDDNDETGASYKVILPGKDENGALTRVKAEIPAASASIGYLDYNLRNFYIQAFKYAGTPYGWGGMKNGVDCSSYVLSVFKSFGFIFPRNTSQQNNAVGNTTDVEGRDDAYKLSVIAEILSESAPVLIYQPGHAMIYLGKIDETHYIIHAPGGGSVREDSYDGFSSLTRICGVSPLK